MSKNYKFYIIGILKMYRTWLCGDISWLLYKNVKWISNGLNCIFAQINSQLLIQTIKNNKFVVSGILWTWKTTWDQKTSKLICAQTWCIQIHSNHYSDYNLNSKNVFGANTITVGLSYSTLSSSTTIQNIWTTLQIFKFKNEDFSISIIELIL
jgi:hypothetical protein